FRFSDVFFSGAFSWNAGTHEEAFFRGWLHPVFNEWIGVPWIANTLQASLFALAHLPTNPLPWPQFMMGWYWGWLSTHRGWTLSESVFIHAWWDVMAFTFLYATHSDTEEGEIWLPLARIPF
ncbi:MAG: CPBP family intramembrane glutamic endopeptidase, partial [Bdellovibrionota bacterium]